MAKMPKAPRRADQFSSQKGTEFPNAQGAPNPSQSGLAKDSVGYQESKVEDNAALSQALSGYENSPHLEGQDNILPNKMSGDAKLYDPRLGPEQNN